MLQIHTYIYTHILYERIPRRREHRDYRDYQVPSTVHKHLHESNTV
jgi:hypothetical protein